MKVFIFFSLVIAGMILGCIYGIIHDQITYSISPEFYTKVRFWQMDINSDLPRIGVAKVGILNTWFYSLVISIVLSLAGLIHSTNKIIVRYTMQSFIIAISFALISGIAGWIIVYFFSFQDFDNLKLPQTIDSDKPFKTVQLIHNFSYMGGIIGMLIGLGWQFYNKKKDTDFFGRASDDL